MSTNPADIVAVVRNRRPRPPVQTLVILAVVGFIAQLVDGSLGMAYGVTSSTLLIASGVAPAAASAAVHFSEIGTTVASGFAHHKLGNVDWRTVRIIAIPGGIGAFAGATILSNVDGDAAKPWVAALLLGLGAYVLWPVPRARRAPPHVQGRRVRLVPGAARARRRHDGRHRRWRLGPRRDHDPAVDRPDRAPQGRRVDRRLRVHRRRDGLARVPARAREPGHQLRLSRWPCSPAACSRRRSRPGSCATWRRGCWAWPPAG